MDKAKARLTAVYIALEIAKQKHQSFVNDAQSILKDAEDVEKYLLGYEPEPEQE